MLPILLFLLTIATTTGGSAAAAAAAPPPLRPGFYSKTCPRAELIVRKVMKKAMIREPRSGASVMRLQFHDCFVNVNKFPNSYKLLLCFFPQKFRDKNL